MNNKIILQADKVSKHFDMGNKQIVHAVDNVSLSIKQNEVLGLVGESGSGKTTLGKALIGLHDKTSGSVHYKGKALPSHYKTRDFKSQAEQIQIIFQDPYSSLNPRMTILEIIAEGLLIRDKAKLSQVKDKVAYWLERVGLSADQMSRYPHEFSGGQRQRVGIARALIVEPSFLICDEPISALDVSVQAQVVQLLAELKTSMDLSMLFIAHDLSMVRYVSDRMAVMYLGSLIEVGQADEVYFNAKHPYTQLLIKSNPEPDPKSERHRKSPLIQGEIPSPVNLQPGCRFAGRCPLVESHCRESTPELREVADGHLVACHLV